MSWPAGCANSRQDLKAADSLERSAAAWREKRQRRRVATGRHPAIRRRSPGRRRVPPATRRTHDYLAASRQRENQRLLTEEQHRQAELRNAQERQHTAEAHAAPSANAPASCEPSSPSRRSSPSSPSLVAVTAAIGFHRANRRRTPSQRRVSARRPASGWSPRPKACWPAPTPEATCAHSSSCSPPDYLAPRRRSPLLGLLLPDDSSATPKIAEDDSVHQQRGVQPRRHRIVSGGDDHTVRLWDADTGQPIGAAADRPHRARWPVWRSAPTGSASSPAVRDHTVRVWDADTGQPIGAPADRPHRRGGECGVQPRRARGSSPAVATTPCGCGTPTPANRSAHPLTGHTDAVDSVAFSPDGTRIVSGSWRQHGADVGRRHRPTPRRTR